MYITYIPILAAEAAAISSNLAHFAAWLQWSLFQWRLLLSLLSLLDSWLAGATLRQNRPRGQSSRDKENACDGRSLSDAAYQCGSRNNNNNIKKKELISANRLTEQFHVYVCVSEHSKSSVHRIAAWFELRLRMGLHSRRGFCFDFGFVLSLSFSLSGCSSGWLAGWIAGWLAGWLAGCLGLE